ncbi:MAG: hypothetical protein R3Y13_05950 [bacterium]
MNIKNILLYNGTVAEFSIPINDSLTVFHGFTGLGKTLLYKLMVYCLGKSEKIDLDELKKNPLFKNINFIGIEIEDTIYKREIINYLEKNFYAVRQNNEIVEYFDKKKYRIEIAKIFNHKDVKVLSKEKEYKYTTFTIAEYIKELFFNEERVLGEKSLSNYLGHAQEIKLKNYYKYFLTGYNIKDTNTEISKKEKKVPSGAQLKKTLLYLLDKSKFNVENQVNKSKQVEIEILKKEKNIEHVEKLLENLTLEIKQQNISIIRKQSLKDLYVSQLEELQLLESFDKLASSNFTICANCGEKNLWEQSNVECMIKDVKLSLTDIDDVLNYNNAILSKFKLEQERNEEIIKNFKVDLVNLKDQSYAINKEIELYSALKVIKENKSFLESKSEKTDITKERLSELDELFDKEIIILSNNISKRLKSWGLISISNVEFDKDIFDFKFNGTIRHIMAKGFRPPVTIAILLELILHMRGKGIPVLDFIFIDTIWQLGEFAEIKKEDFVKKVLDDLKQISIQIILFENNIYSYYNTTDICIDIKDIIK